MTMEHKNEIIEQAYLRLRNRIFAYVYKRINDKEEAADIVQDVFVRLLTCDVVCEETIRSLVFFIANNLVIDHLRHHYRREEAYSYIYDVNTKAIALRPGQEMAVRDIEALERSFVKRLSPATARVYEMTRTREMSIEEIAGELSLSKRTVECHQFVGRKYVRERMRKVL